MRKRKKIWIDKGSNFYNSSFKKLSKDNDAEIYSIHNIKYTMRENLLFLKDLLQL